MHAANSPTNVTAVDHVYAAKVAKHFLIGRQPRDKIAHTSAVTPQAAQEQHRCGDGPGAYSVLGFGKRKESLLRECSRYRLIRRRIVDPRTFRLWLSVVVMALVLSV